MRTTPETIINFYTSQPTYKLAIVPREPSRHQWHLIVTQNDHPMHVPVTSYSHLCHRIGEMIMSTGIQIVDVYRDDEQYRYVQVREQE